MIPLHGSLHPDERPSFHQEKVRKDVFIPFPIYSIVGHGLEEFLPLVGDMWRVAMEYARLGAKSSTNKGQSSVY